MSKLEKASTIAKMAMAKMEGYDEVIFVVEEVNTGTLQVVGVSGEFVFYRSHSFPALGNEERRRALEVVVEAANEYFAPDAEVGQGTYLNDALYEAGFVN